MLIKSGKPNDLKESDVTDEKIYIARRKFIQQAAVATGLLSASLPISSLLAAPNKPVLQPLKHTKTTYGSGLKLTANDHVTGYNNFYEFGTAKTDPAKYAHILKTDPWGITIEGHAEKTGYVGLEEILKRHTLEERIYRLRCVEAWSMVVPWIGFSLADFIKQFKPTSKAKYVEFQTLHNPLTMPGQKRSVLDWPYTEGLRMDEAMNPLSMLVVGLYGKQLPNQNGAPIRLMVPWKYGFKNIKSIVKIRFVEKQPVTSWVTAGPHEYGFYANVNPEVDHPRWTQKRERIIGTYRRRKTDLFNGYADQVAGLYAGMDLRKQY